MESEPLKRHDDGSTVVSLLTISFAALVTAIGACASVESAPAATLKILHSFCSQNACADGLNPTDGLLQDAQGNLYGQTTEGGSFGHGTVFQLRGPTEKNNYKLRVLHDFCFDAGNDCRAGETPGNGGHLIVDTKGNIYAAVSDSEGGVVLKLKPHEGGKRWSSRALYEFCSLQDCVDGFGPASLTYPGAAMGTPYDGASPLYGVAQFGGKNGKGVAFKLTPKPRGHWAEHVLYDFCAQAECTDGANPAFDLLLDTAGSLFGVTTDDGSGSNPGVVFKLSPSPGSAWKESVLHAFCSAQDCADGRTPSGGLVMDAADNLLGVTAFGGNPKCRSGGGCGIVYKITSGGTYSVVHTFCSEVDCADGELPFGRLATDAAGNLYGTTQVGGGHQGGTLFQLSGGDYQVLFDFCSGACQTATEPTAGVIKDPDGNFLGAAGGGNAGLGVVYRLARTRTQ